MKSKSKFQSFLLGNYNTVQYSRSNTKIKNKYIYIYFKMPVGPLCYTVHADSYLRIEKPKKHVAYGHSSLWPEATTFKGGYGCYL